MKDPSNEILTAFNTALIGTTYGGETIQLFNDLPEPSIKKYILIHPPECIDDITGNYFESECFMDIEICVKGYYHQANIVPINTISTSVQEAVIKQDLSMTNFTMGVTPHLITSTFLRQKEGNEILTKKLINVRFTVKQN